MKYVIFQNERGVWIIKAYRRIESQMQLCQEIGCINIEAVKTVLEMLNGSSSITIHTAV